MRKDPLVLLRHIRDAIAKIERFTAGGREAFLGDDLVQDGVIRNLEVIGEAVKNLPEGVTAAHPEVGWGGARRRGCGTS